LINDAPLVLRDEQLEDVWRPENHSGTFGGDTPLREALVRSLNLVSVRVILKVGPGTTVRHLRKFGFDDEALPPNPSLALGAGGVAPIDLAAGFAVFANGGSRVPPYYIERIEDLGGDVLYSASPPLACTDCDDAKDSSEKVDLIDDVTELYPMRLNAPRAISRQNAYLITDMMQDVIRRGTGRRALQLGRKDLAGKTGTSTNSRDTWFAGFNADLVATTWVGFDEDRPLGDREEGARTALPVWNAFMAEALAGAPEHVLPRPPGIIDVRIDPKTGLRANSATKASVFEKFNVDNLPGWEPETTSESAPSVMSGPERNQELEPIF
jgi:penicillin-binding protein 1A